MTGASLCQVAYVGIMLHKQDKEKIPGFSETHGPVFPADNVLPGSTWELGQKPNTPSKETSVHVEQNQSWVFTGVLPIRTECNLMIYEIKKFT